CSAASEIMLPAMCMDCIVASACCANIVTIDIAPPRVLVSGKQLLCSHCLQTFEFDSIGLVSYAADLFYRLSGGSHHLRLSFSDRGIIQQCAKAHSLKAFATDELCKDGPSAHLEEAAHDEIAVYDDQHDDAFAEASAHMPGANKTIRIFRSDALHHIGIVLHLEPDAQRLEAPQQGERQQSPLPDSHFVLLPRRATGIIFRVRLSVIREH